MLGCIETEFGDHNGVWTRFSTQATQPCWSQIQFKFQKRLQPVVDFVFHFCKYMIIPCFLSETCMADAWWINSDLKRTLHDEAMIFLQRERFRDSTRSVQSFSSFGPSSVNDGRLQRRRSRQSQRFSATIAQLTRAYFESVSTAHHFLARSANALLYPFHVYRCIRFSRHVWRLELKRESPRASARRRKQGWLEKATSPTNLSSQSYW